MAEKEPSMDEILNSIRTILAEGEADASDSDVKGESKDVQETLQTVNAEPAVEEIVSEPEVMPEEENISVVRNVAVEPEKQDFAEEAQQSGGEDEETVEVTEDMIVSRKETVVQNDVGVAFVEEEKVLPKENNMTAYFNEKNDELISAATQASAAASLAQLTQMFSAQKAPSAPIQGSGMTLEFLVAELIKPYLKEWLDKNLPAIVDEAVKREIARIVDRSIR